MDQNQALSGGTDGGVCREGGGGGGVVREKEYLIGLCHLGSPQITLSQSLSFLAGCPQIPGSFAIFSACYRGHLGPSGPNDQKKSENGFPAPLGPGGRKGRKRVEKESKKSPKSAMIVNFGLFFDSFSTFSTPGAERPREPIFGPFLDFGPEVPK